MRRAFCGSLSGGKTVLAVKFAKDRQISKGKKIISNMKLRGLDYKHMPNKEFVDFLLEYYEDTRIIGKFFENKILLLDEVTHLISARKSLSDLNEKISSLFMYLGKKNCDLFITAQSYESMVDNRIRLVIPKVAECIRVYADNNNMVSDEEDRIINRQIKIVTIWEHLFIFGIKKYTSNIYYVDDYFQHYDTEEMLTLDRTAYLKSSKGVKDNRHVSVFNLFKK